MPYRELLGHPLEIDPDDLPSRLTECALYPEFAERFADAFDLIDEGQHLWKNFTPMIKAGIQLRARLPLE